MLQLLQPLLGVFVFISIAWILSDKQSAIRPKTVIAGLLTQFLLGLLLLKTPGMQKIFLSLVDRYSMVRSSSSRCFDGCEDDFK